MSPLSSAARSEKIECPLCLFELLLSVYDCPSDDWSAKGKLLLDHGAQVPPRLTDGKATLEVAAEYARDCKVADADVFIAALREHLARTDRA